MVPDLFQPVPERATIAQAAELLGCSRRTVWRRLRDGTLRQLTPIPADGGKTMIHGPSIEPLLRSRWFTRDDAS